MAAIHRAISIRQPYVELILRRKKKFEYRSWRTHVRERVYLYAARVPADDPPQWRKVRAKPGSLPTGAIVGSVEITGCVWSKRYKCYAFALAKPKRLARRRRATNYPQPGFWKPTFA